MSLLDKLSWVNKIEEQDKMKVDATRLINMLHICRIKNPATSTRI